jgi:putative endonuclease
VERKDTGKLGEKLAADFLKMKGYRIVETNYRCTEGEIDIVARHQGAIVFIEVRTKANLNFGSPEESITFAKMRKLRAASARYLQHHPGMPESWRIDMVAVQLDGNGRTSRIEVIENAIGGSE